MHFLIDGHNLIGVLPQIDLSDPEDEAKLVQLLRSWAAGSRRRQVTVIFDGGLPGGLDRALSSGQVRVVFASSGQTADALLIGRIRRAKNPGAYTLVSNDRHIIRAAETARVTVCTSSQFVARLVGRQETSEIQPDDQERDKYQPSLEKDELAMWMKTFGLNDEND